jgi:hypothetical protein
MEKEIRETTMAQVMPELTKGEITKAIRNMGANLHQNIESLTSCRIRLRMSSIN